MEIFLHHYGKELKHTKDYNGSIIQSLEHNLGLNKTSTCMTLWLKRIDRYALIMKLEDKKEEYIHHLADMVNID